MLISNFNESVKVLKNMKASMVASSYNDPNLIIGSYDGFNIIRVMDLNGYEVDPSILNLLSGNNWINFGITAKIDTDGTIPQEMIPLINGPAIRNDNNVQIYFVDVKKELNNKLNNLIGLLSAYEKTYSDIVFNEGSFFEEFNKQKATDGGIRLVIDHRVIMTLYKGLIPYNKSDIVKYNIYCGERDFIAEFITTKKKLPEIRTYIRYLYL